MYYIRKWVNHEYKFRLRIIEECVNLDVGCGWREEGFLKNIAACIQHES